MNFNFELYEGLLIGQIGDQKLIIDTGAPLSFAREGIDMDGLVTEVSTEFMGYDADYLSEKTSIHVDGILGCDILNEYSFCIDYKKQKIIFNSDTLPVKTKGIEMHEAMGMPYALDVICAGKKQRCYLDTGASVSYMEPGDLAICNSVGHYEDFNPVFGDFSTELYQCPTEVAGHAFDAKCGQLPDSASMLLPMMGVTGILGVDILKAYRITFMPSKARIYLEDYEESTAHDSWASVYDRVNESSFGSMVTDLTDTTLDLIENEMEDIETILDLGAGTGRLSIPLSKAGYEVTAVDASAVMVEEHNKKISESGLNYRVEHSLLQDYVPSQQFDLIICLHTVMAYLTTEEDLDKAAGVFYLATKNNSKVLIDFPDGGLFESHVHQHGSFTREISFKRKNNNCYEYSENTFNDVEDGYEYSDSFMLRAWTMPEIITAFTKAGLILMEDLSEKFMGTGHYHLLFGRQV